MPQDIKKLAPVYQTVLKQENGVLNIFLFTIVLEDINGFQRLIQFSVEQPDKPMFNFEESQLSKPIVLVPLVAKINKELIYLNDKKGNQLFDTYTENDIELGTAFTKYKYATNIYDSRFYLISGASK